MVEILVSIHEFTGNTVKNDTNDQDENNCDKFHIQITLVGVYLLCRISSRMKSDHCFAIATATWGKVLER